MVKKQTPADEQNSGIFGSFVRFKHYLELSRAELRKVSWPTMKETKMTSLVVVGFVAVMVLFLGLVDLGLSTVIAMILSA